MTIQEPMSESRAQYEDDSDEKIESAADLRNLVVKVFHDDCA